MSTYYAQVSSRTFKINVSQEGNTLDLQERKLINVLRGTHLRAHTDSGGALTLFPVVCKALGPGGTQVVPHFSSLGLHSRCWNRG